MDDCCCDADLKEWMYYRELYSNHWYKHDLDRTSFSYNESRMQNTLYSHRNHVSLNHRITTCHKQQGTLLYSLYVSCFFVCKVIEESLTLQCVLYRMLTIVEATLTFLLLFSVVFPSSEPCWNLVEENENQMDQAIGLCKYWRPLLCRQ